MFFCYPLKSETNSKLLLKWTGGNQGFNIFWHFFPRRLQEASEMSPGSQNKLISALNSTCCCLQFYFSLQRQENITHRLYAKLVWGCGDDTPQASSIYIYIYMYYSIYVYIYIFATCEVCVCYILLYICKFRTGHPVMTSPAPAAGRGELTTGGGGDDSRVTGGCTRANKIREIRNSD